MRLPFRITFKNFTIPKRKPDANGVKLSPANIPFQERNAKMTMSYAMPLQLERLTHDIGMWREAIRTAEQAWFPTRYHMQRMFVDTILEGHTKSCIRRRKALTLLKDFIIVDEKGEQVEEATKLFKDRRWFYNLISYIMDAQFFGYSLIQLGDLIQVNGKYDFPQLSVIKRWHVEPDRQNMVSIPLQKTGINFLDPSEKDDAGISYYDFTVYVDTPSDTGHSICGYGLLYEVAMYAIFLKNNLAGNADFNQMFGTPYRHAKVPPGYGGDKTDLVESALRDMGMNGYLVTDENVNLQWLTTNTGTGHQSYESLEKRLEAKITRLFFGHEDAMSSTPGKIGGSQGSNKGNGDEDNSPAGIAMRETEKEQDAFVLSVLNDVVLPKLRNLGFKVAEGLTFNVSNDKEKFEARKKSDAANLTTAQVWQTAKNGGLKLDAKKFTEITGIDCEEVAEPSSGEDPKQAQERRLAMKNRLDLIYKAKG